RAHSHALTLSSLQRLHERRHVAAGRDRAREARDLGIKPRQLGAELVRVVATLIGVSRERDLACTTSHAHHLGALSLFAESSVSRRQRVRFLGNGAAARIANATGRYRAAPPADGSSQPPRGRATGAKLRRRMAEL